MVFGKLDEVGRGGDPAREGVALLGLHHHSEGAPLQVHELIARREAAEAAPLEGVPDEGQDPRQDQPAGMERVDRATPRRREIHLVLDNHGTHKHAEVKAWFAAHHRYHLHFVPTGSSWLNLVARWFGEITRKRIRRGAFRNVPELVRAIYQYLREINENPRPFIWTATAAKILRKVKHCKETLESAH